MVLWKTSECGALQAVNFAWIRQAGSTGYQESPWKFLRAGLSLSLRRMPARSPRRMKYGFSRVQRNDSNALGRRAGRKQDLAGWIRAGAVVAFLQPIQPGYGEP